MKPYILFFLTIYSIILIGCNKVQKKQTQKEATRYYNDLTKNATHTEKKSEDFTNYFQSVAFMAKADPNYQLSQGKIDSLHYYYLTLKSGMRKTIAELHHLKEFDENFATLRLLTESYQITQNAYDSVIPAYLSVYKIGWTKASSIQRETILKSSTVLSSAHDMARLKTDSFIVQIMSFINKYDLSIK